MILSKADSYVSDEQLEVLSREYIIHYRACMGSLIYLSYKRLYLFFAVHNLECFSSNHGKLQVKGLVHLLRYIRYNEN